MAEIPALQALVVNNSAALARLCADLDAQNAIAEALLAQIRDTVDTAAPVTVTGGLGATVLADAPLSYWPMQEKSGTTQMPSVGSLSAPLVLQGDMWDVDTTAYRLSPYALGKITRGTELSRGAWGYANAAYDFSGGLTFEAWCSPQNWNWIQTVFAVVKSGTQVWSIDHLPGTGFRINEKAIGDVTLDPAKLHHLAVTVTSAGLASLWWDGAQVGASVQVAAPTSGDRVQVGKKLTMTRADGSEDYGQVIGSAWTHIAVYGKALTTERIKAHRDAGLGAAPMPRRGRYNVETTDPAKLFAGRSKSAFYAAKDKFRSVTWWGGISTPEEAIAEKAAGSEAMVVITRWEDPANYTAAGLYAIPVVGSAKWNSDQLPSAGFKASDRIVAWATEDEMTLGLDDVPYGTGILASDLDKCDPALPSWANHGYDVIAYRTPAEVNAILNVKGVTSGRKMDIQGADYYTHSTDPLIRKDMGQKLGLLPSDGSAASEAAANRDQAKLRHSFLSFENVRQMRAAYDHDVLHQAFIGIGHANAVTGGMPTGREVRGDIWASIIAGAQTMALFYHSFADCGGWWNGGSFKASDRRCYGYGDNTYWSPTVEGTTPGVPPSTTNTQWKRQQYPYLPWDAAYDYPLDATVERNGQFYCSVKNPPKGIAPEADLYNDATDTGSWVKFAYQAQGLRNIAVSSAPGMQGWINKSQAEANKLAKLIHSPAGDLALCDSRLIWRHWPNAGKFVLDGDSMAYAWTAVMQGWDQWSGTYAVSIPAGVTSVDVYTDLTKTPTTVPVSGGKIQISFNAEHEVRFLRWPAA